MELLDCVDFFFYFLLFINGSLGGLIVDIFGCRLLYNGARRTAVPCHSHKITLL